MGQSGVQVLPVMTVVGDDVGDDAGGKASDEKAVGSTEPTGEATDNVDEQGGHPRALVLELDNLGVGTRAGSEVAELGGLVENDAECAEEGDISNTRHGGVGQASNQAMRSSSYAGGLTKTRRSGVSSSKYCSASMEEVDRSCGADSLNNNGMGKQFMGSFVGDEDSRLGIVPFSQTEREQSDFYLTGEVMKMGMGTGAYTVYEGGSSSGALVEVEGEKFIDVPLEIEPLEAHPNCPEGKVCEWIIERVKGMCHVWGMSCEGYEGELEKLFRKIESNRGKANSPAATPSKSIVKGNRELRGLQWNMNSKGKQGKEKRGKNQKQRARGGDCLVIK